MGKEVVVNPMEQAVADIINKAVVGLDKSIDFMSAQLPDVIQQLLWWKFAESFILFLCGFLVLGLIALMHYSFYKYVKKNNLNGDHGVWPLWVIGGSLVTLFGVAFIFTECFNFTWLQIWIAPKIYLIEYAAHLIGGK
jgi:hypothetical protein